MSKFDWSGEKDSRWENATLKWERIGFIQYSDNICPSQLLLIAQTQEKYTINICRVSTNSALPVEWSLLLKHPEIFSNLTPQWRFTAKIAETALCLWIYNYKNAYVHSNNEIILKMSSDFEIFSWYVNAYVTAFLSRVLW